MAMFKEYVSMSSRAARLFGIRRTAAFERSSIKQFSTGVRRYKCPQGIAFNGFPDTCSSSYDISLSQLDPISSLMHWFGFSLLTLSFSFPSSLAQDFSIPPGWRVSPFLIDRFAPPGPVVDPVLHRMRRLFLLAKRQTIFCALSLIALFPLSSQQPVRQIVRNIDLCFGLQPP